MKRSLRPGESSLATAVRDVAVSCCQNQDHFSVTNKNRGGGFCPGAIAEGILVNTLGLSALNNRVSLPFILAQSHSALTATLTRNNFVIVAASGRENDYVARCDRYLGAQ